MAAISALPAGCLLMAAGNASRFGENKLAARFDGRACSRWRLRRSRRRCSPGVTVVSQYPALLEEASLAGFDTILNDRPEDGISRHHPPRHAGDGGLRRYFIYGRRPAAAAGRDGAARRGRVAGEPGLHRRCGAQRKARQPVPVPGAVLPELCALEADRGGSSVIRRHEDALLLVEAGERELFDCDTKQALEILKGNA